MQPSKAQIFSAVVEPTQLSSEETLSKRAAQRYVKKMDNTHLTSHIDSLYGYAIFLSRNATNAEDLVQETYVRALQAIDSLRPDSNVKSWLFTILRNVWLNQLRQRRNNPMFIELDGGNDMEHLSSDPTNNSLDIYIAKMEDESVRKAIRSLPSEYREVIHLREYEYLSYREIAVILDCPTGTVMSRLSRARIKLRQAMTAMRATDRGVDRRNIMGGDVT
jgi:RNA polymerase sigma-70 factor (ECF subfamily)